MKSFVEFGSQSDISMPISNTFNPKRRLQRSIWWKRVGVKRGTSFSTRVWSRGDVELGPMRTDGKAEIQLLCKIPSFNEELATFTKESP